MTLKSVTIENNYGKNTSLVSIFANHYTQDEAIEMVNQKFESKENISKKEMMQMKIDGPISEEMQPSYVQKMINYLHNKNNIWFSYDNSFVISWKDRKTGEKRIFSNLKK